MEAGGGIFLLWGIRNNLEDEISFNSTPRKAKGTGGGGAGEYSPFSP